MSTLDTKDRPVTLSVRTRADQQQLTIDSRARPKKMSLDVRLRTTTLTAFEDAHVRSSGKNEIPLPHPPLFYLAIQEPKVQGDLIIGNFSVRRNVVFSAYVPPGGGGQLSDYLYTNSQYLISFDTRSIPTDSNVERATLGLSILAPTRIFQNPNAFLAIDAFPWGDSGYIAHGGHYTPYPTELLGLDGSLSLALSIPSNPTFVVRPTSVVRGGYTDFRLGLGGFDRYDVPLSLNEFYIFTVTDPPIIGLPQYVPPTLTVTYRSSGAPSPTLGVNSRSRPITATLKST